MEIKLAFTDTSSYVLTAKNKDNSEFYIQPKSAYEREKEMGKGGLVVSTGNEGFAEESEIIKSIESGTKFYTHFENTFTDVKVVSGHLRSVRNGTTKDNIDELSVIK